VALGTTGTAGALLLYCVLGAPGAPDSQVAPLQLPAAHGDGRAAARAELVAALLGWRGAKDKVRTVMNAVDAAAAEAPAAAAPAGALHCVQRCSPDRRGRLRLLGPWCCGLS
jgi:hypothetical protein